MAIYLYLDTSSEASSIMLLQDGKVMAFRTNAIQKDHASLINLHIAELLDEMAIKMSDLAGVCVLNGPGSYTGLRISLATAKGICYACQIPLFLFNRLDLLFHQSSVDKRNETNVVAITAREDEYFCASYDYEGNRVIEPGLSTSADISALMAQNTCSLFYIDDTMSEKWPSSVQLVLTSEGVASFIEHRLKTEKPADLFLSEPFYMKNVHINKINKL
jgi:tRNA threonylcarbamoyladenosine biosynthesis protein TsaB